MSQDKLSQKALEPKLAYSVPSLAKASDVSESLLWNEIRDGELESCLAGDRRLITPQQAARWLKRKANRAKQVREQRAKERDQRQLELIDE